MKRFLTLLFFLAPFVSFSQIGPRAHAGQIKMKLKKLNFLGSVLYVAAHPDDENTRIITSMANDRLAATAYLSMTRGDGGQNLIGPEIRDVLGLIRTQELLSARRIDGGEQFFTRANDFGYSKSADETFAIWNKNEIMSDVVYVFRQYQPDVIITRFPPDERAGHGHHTASAILAQEAFDLAADAKSFPDNGKTYGTWRPTRLYTNTGRWWNQTINENTPGIITIDVGRYNALLGESYSEIAARSRSQHKSQGFGSKGTRGYQPEFLEHVKGEKASKDIFEGINTTWSRVPGSEKVQALVTKLIHEFDEENPAASVVGLTALRKELLALKPGVWRDRKLKEVEALIFDCAGIFLEASSDFYWSSPGETSTIFFELINRSDVPVTISQISSSQIGMDSSVTVRLDNNVPVNFKSRKTISSVQSYSDPYWLSQPHSLGLFTVAEQKNIGKPENDAAVKIRFTMMIDGQVMDVERPVVYKMTDPVKGELYRPFEIVPPVFVNLFEKVLVFADAQPKEVVVMVKSSAGKVKGNLKLQLPSGWRSEPESIPFDLTAREQEQLKTFKVFPAKNEITASLKAIAEVDGKKYDKSIQTVSYDHIPTQILLPESSARIVRLNIKTAGSIVGYIKGAGDEVPNALRNMGYEVWEMKNEEVNLANLKKLDAVVLGIRALNTNTRVRFMMDDLLTYVKEGGNLIVQYNNNFDLETDSFSPYPLTLSRDRVTDENSDVRMLKADHSILNVPNKIADADFSGWVQERGLYFPNKWDPNFEALLSMNDKGEQPKDGSLLVARYGSGYYIYTGLSFFRELPEGVSGAYKLFANLVSAGKGKPLNGSKSKTGSR